MSDWAEFLCNQYQPLTDSSPGFNNFTNDSCSSIQSSSSCYQHSGERPPRFKPKQIVQPSATFADHPFVPSRQSSKIKHHKSKSPKQIPARANTSLAPANRLKAEEEKVEKFLHSNPEFLVAYVNKFVDPEILSQWSKNAQASDEWAIPEDLELVVPPDFTNVKTSTEAEEDHEQMINEVVNQENETESIENSEAPGETEVTQVDKIQEIETIAENVVPSGVVEETTAVTEKIEMNAEESSVPVLPDNMVTTSTSTEDATLSPFDLCLPELLVSKSTSTTDGLILAKPLGLQLTNPKLEANMSKLTKIREARSKHKECLEAKARQAERDLARARRRERSLARKAIQAAKKEAAANSSKREGHQKGRGIRKFQTGQTGSFDAGSADARLVDDEFTSMMIKFHNKPPRCPVTHCDTANGSDLSTNEVDEPCQFVVPSCDSHYTHDRYAANSKF